MRRRWLFCWTTTSLLRNFWGTALLAFWKAFANCFSFDNWNLLNLLSLYLDWYVLSYDDDYDDDDDDDELFLWYGWSTKGVQPYFQPGPLSEIFIIVNLWHAVSRIWTCAEPEFRLSLMKLCSSDNHYTTAPLFAFRMGGKFSFLFAIWL